MYRHILVPLDGSALAEQVLPHVQSLAKGSPNSRITLLRAVPITNLATAEFAGMYTGALSPAEEIAQAEAAAYDYLNAIASVLQSEGYRVATEVSKLSAAESIVDFAEKHNVDLIAIATHGRSGFSRWIFGSVTQKVVQASPVPVLVIRPKAS